MSKWPDLRQTRDAPVGPTTKEALIKLKALHQLPSVIIEWRKINAAVTNIISPFEGASEAWREADGTGLVTYAIIRC